MRDSCHFAMNERAKSGEVRNDLIDALLALREEDKDKPFSYTNIGMCVWHVFDMCSYHL